MLQYDVGALRLDAHGSLVTTKNARLIADTDLTGRLDAMNPAELLLASLAACILKGAERVLPILEFKFKTIGVRLHGVHQDSPPKMLSIAYVITVDTDEPDHRLELLHTNIRKYGTISNTLATSVALTGTIVRRAPDVGR
jgi:uncharacterized OsmC-like protein